MSQIAVRLDCERMRTQSGGCQRHSLQQHISIAFSADNHYKGPDTKGSQEDHRARQADKSEDTTETKRVTGLFIHKDGMGFGTGNRSITRQSYSYYE